MFFSSAVSQTFFSKPPGGLYSLPYLSEGLQSEPVSLSRAEWWEILFFIKKLEPKQQQEVNDVLLQSLEDQVTGCNLFILPESLLVQTQVLVY